MVMGMIWMVLVVTAVIAAALEGNLGALSPAVMEGASSAIRLALSLAGALCLWSALAKLMEKAGALRGGENPLWTFCPLFARIQKESQQRSFLRWKS